MPHKTPQTFLSAAGHCNKELKGLGKLNIEETAKILAMIALIENRKFTDEQIAAWQVLLKDINVDHASQAVVRHYQGQTDQIKPAHIFKLSKEIKAEAGKRVYAKSDN